MAVRNIGITARLYFTNLLLYLRTLLIGGFFLLIPFLASSALAYFTVTTVQFFFLWVFLPVLVVLFIFIVHLNSTLEIFILALWYEAYQACREEDKLYQDHEKDDK